MRGIGCGAVADDELRIEELAGLLGNTFQRHRVADPPYLAEQVQVRLADLDVVLAQSLEQKVEKAAHLRKIDGVGGAGNPQLRQAEFSVNERIGDQYMEDVDEDDPLHGGPRVADAVHDGGEDVEAGGKGEIEEHQPDIAGGKGQYIALCPEEAGQFVAESPAEKACCDRHAGTGKTGGKGGPARFFMVACSP